MTGPIAKQTLRVKQNKICKCLSEHGGEIMKIGMLAVSVIGFKFHRWRFGGRFDPSDPAVAQSGLNESSSEGMP
jgi:hypothetical protein